MTFVNSSSISGSGLNVNCALPAGAQVNDVLLAFHAIDVDNYVGMSANAAFTLQGGSSAGASARARFYTRVITGGEAGSYTFSSTSTAENTVLMGLFRDVTLTGFTSNLGSTPTDNNIWTCPSLSPATGTGDLISYVAYGSDNVVNSFTPPTGMTERVDLQSSTWISTSYATLANPGTPTGSRDFTSTQTISWTTGAAVFSIYLPLSAVPSVNAGADTTATVGYTFDLTATEVGAYTTRSWTIISGPTGVGSTIGSAQRLFWVPTQSGTYVLRYTADALTDDVTVVVQTPFAGPFDPLSVFRDIRYRR